MNTDRTFSVGAWQVDPRRDRIFRGSHSVDLRPQVMELLVYLAGRPGEVVATDDLLRELWPGKVVTEGSVYSGIAELRRALGGDADRNAYIETVPKRGYRLRARIVAAAEAPDPLPKSHTAGHWRRWVGATASLAIVMAMAYLALVSERPLPPATLDQPATTDLSIAVLPFTDLSTEGDQGHIAQGIAEQLLTTLAMLTELRVVARSSSFAMDPTAQSSAEIADLLKTRFLLEGSVIRQADRLRISVQLIDVETGVQRWSETYDRAMGDVFTIQDQVARRVARELQVRIVRPPPTPAGAAPVVYETYLKGLALLAQRDGRIKEAVELFDQVIAMEPGFAPAYGSLALALIWAELDARIEPAVSRALAVDPNNADALTALGFLRDAQGRKREARLAFQQAIRQNPSHAMAYRLLGRSLQSGDPLRYLELSRKSYLLDPLDPTIHFHLAMALSGVGRYEEARAAARELAIRDNSGLGEVTMGLVQLKTGHLADAVRSYLRAYELDPKFAMNISNLPWALMELGEYELADAWIRETGTHHALRMQRVVLNALRGHEALAMELALAAVASGEWPESQLAGAHLQVNGDFDAARTAIEAQGAGELPSATDINARNWQNAMDYGLILQRTGAPVRADELLRAATAFIQSQLEAGVASFPEEIISLRFFLGALHALQGDAESAIETLRAVSSAGEFLCAMCLRNWPYFDSLRKHPEFLELLAQQESLIASERQRLRERDLLRTPDQMRRPREFAQHQVPGT